MRTRSEIERKTKHLGFPKYSGIHGFLESGCAGEAEGAKEAHEVEMLPY